VIFARFNSLYSIQSSNGPTNHWNELGGVGLAPTTMQHCVLLKREFSQAVQDWYWLLCQMIIAHWMSIRTLNKPIWPACRTLNIQYVEGMLHQPMQNHIFYARANANLWKNNVFLPLLCMAIGWRAASIGYLSAPPYLRCCLTFGPSRAGLSAEVTWASGTFGLSTCEYPTKNIEGNGNCAIQ
jgi:hypothetical protein